MPPFRLQLPHNYQLTHPTAGPHSCIGEKFARAEFACLMAAMVGRFEMRLGPDEKLPKARPGINPLPEGDLELRLRVVAGW